MPKHGKKFRTAAEAVDSTQRYAIEDGVKLAVEKSFAKFDETVDVAINLGVDPKYSDQMVRGAVILPNGLGKEVRVAVFCKGDKVAEAEAAGADVVGAEDLVEKIQGGWLEFDKAVAAPDMMAFVGKIGKILGPRGLMPNAKLGTVTPNIGDAVRDLKMGKVEYRVDKAGVLHAPIGKVSFGAEKLLENLRTLLDAVSRAKPSTAKGTYIQAVAVATTMGPGVKLDPLNVRKFLDV